MVYKKSICAVLALGCVCASQADSISGFGGGSNWTLNNASGDAAVFTDANTLQITNNYGETNSAFYNTAVAYKSFTASFNYTLDPGWPDDGLSPADGITFVVHNDARGASAIGNGGGDLGYSGDGGITPSIAFALNQFGAHTLGVNVISGGVTNFAYFDVSPVSVRDPLTIDLGYDGSNLQVDITDLTSSATFSQSFAADSSLVGSALAYVGFTGGTGGGTATQSISNFSYNATPEPASMLALGLPMLILKFRKRR